VKGGRIALPTKIALVSSKVQSNKKQNTCPIEQLLGSYIG
jgi:hypothetical protein